jgi:uncharacterized membrane protein
MAVIDTAMQTLHVLFAGLWTGSVVLFALAVLPSGLSGDIGPGPLEAVTSRLTTLSRASALVLFLTGGHLTGTLYTVERLTGTTRGYLVLAMLGLWFVMAGLVEVGGSKMREGLEDEKVRTPAREAKPFYQGAAVVALLLLVDAGLLAGGVV